MNEPLSYEHCDMKISPSGGMRIIKEFYNRIGLHKKIRALSLHVTGSAISVEHYKIVESFMLSAILGAANCTGASQISYDDVLKRLLRVKKERHRKEHF